MARILIVEDDPSIADLLSDHLKRAGHEVEIESDGDAALARFKESAADLIVLDVMLPGRSGFSLCEEIRKGEGDQPVILMLTARVAEADLLLGFELGADDYVRKPFGLQELLARIEALLRLQRRTAGLSGPEEPLHLGPMHIDPARRSVDVRDQPMELTPMEFDLLVYLARRPGQVVPREQLLSDVWRYEHSGYLRTVDTHVNRIRRKLEALSISSQALRTVHGVGYAFEPERLEQDLEREGESQC